MSLNKAGSLITPSSWRGFFRGTGGKMKELLAAILSLVAVYGWFMYMAWPVMSRLAELVNALK
jgi:hypothetical protein